MKKRKMILLLCVVVLLLLCILVNSIVGVPKGLRDTLAEYLEQYTTEYEIYGFTSEEKIDFIRNGAQPLHVAFDPSGYYFVCGYYNDPEGKEIGEYRNAKKYTWVKVGSADKIRESYFGKELIVAFQMNRALFVKDISKDRAYLPGMEHFQIYKPKFKDGENTNPPIDFSETFIYLNGVTTKGGYSYERFKGKGYRSVKQYDHEKLTIRCIYFEGQYYIPIHTHSVYSNGEFYDCTDDNSRRFGKYYDAIENIMETGRYSIDSEGGYGSQHYHKTAHYGLVSVDDFANEIIK